MIRTHIKVVVQQCEEEGYLNYFPFDNQLIQSQWFNWEININMASNRRFDQVVILNLPVDKEEFSDNSIYIHGTKYKRMIHAETLRQKNYFLDVPLQKKL